MGKLMEHAKKMVDLSKNIVESIKLKKGEITDDEVSYIGKTIINGPLSYIDQKG